MATRKQRKRREKEKRHDYEWVYVDSEGNDVEPDGAEPPRSRPASKQSARAGGSPRRSQSRSRWTREPQPPSWQRAIRRGAIFLPIFLIFVLLTNRKQSSVASVVFVTLIFGFFVIPAGYFMDRLVWRSHQRRLGGPASKR